MANNSTVAEFFTALQAAGVAPATLSALVADGRLHRHHIESDKPGSLNGWHVLHADHPASGAGGSWKAGHSVKWCSKRLNALTAPERAEITRRITEDRKRAEAEQAARHAEAARRARLVWDRAGGASLAHAYLLKKRIGAGLARQADGLLLLPVYDFDGRLHGLQYIDETGQKRFSSGMSKRGHFIPVSGLPDGSRPLWIAEGWATSSTLATMKPEACHIAGLDAGNLAAVATEARRRWPKLEIVVCPDFDRVGMTKSKAAAEAARAMLLPPPAHIPECATDFNDWVVWRKSQRREASHV